MVMQNDPTSRALQLLSLLQTHRFWRSTELADRLETTQRTVRRDIERLRDLGYPVDATPGRYGGYRLAAGSHVPPLILDDEEAVAVAVGLRYAAETTVAGTEETALRALTKIEGLLPHRLRRRVSAVHSHVSALRRASDDDAIDPEAISVLAAACRDLEHVRFEYRSGDGGVSRRKVEPHELITAGHRWYLVAWDADVAEWRTFRLDRLRAPRPVASHFTQREIPGGDAGALVGQSVGHTPRHASATLAIDADLAGLEPVLRWIDHVPVESREESCVVEIRGEDLGRLAMTVARLALTAPVRVLEPPELTDAVRQLGRHLTGSSA